MKYCSNCGKELIGNVKFCTSCGVKTEIIQSKVEKLLRHKRESKSLKDNAIDFGKKTLQNDFGKRLQDETTNYVKSKFEDALTSKVSNEKSTTNNFSETQTLENKTISEKKALNKWTLIYIIINAFLMVLGSQSDEVMGVLIFSVLILVIVFFRRKKEKPYNWLVKIIQVIQIVLLFALIAESIEYISVFTLVFIGLLLTNVILLFKGNNS